mmetsp:Transcript_37754/g.82679  ORF Transcript_37754/g.82679 Transcript_37754/m.82679 type:complete len:227 (+) Transcript_37754:724-1404(+)
MDPATLSVDVDAHRSSCTSVGTSSPILPDPLPSCPAALLPGSPAGGLPLFLAPAAQPRAPGASAARTDPAAPSNRCTAGDGVRTPRTEVRTAGMNSPALRKPPAAALPTSPVGRSNPPAPAEKRTSFPVAPGASAARTTNPPAPGDRCTAGEGVRTARTEVGTVPGGEIASGATLHPGDRWPSVLAWRCGGEKLAGRRCSGSAAGGRGAQAHGAGATRVTTCVAPA